MVQVTPEQIRAAVAEVLRVESDRVQESRSVYYRSRLLKVVRAL